MAKLSRKAGSTAQSLYVFLKDSAVTTGAGKTGIAFNAAGLTAHYTRPRAAPVAIALVTQTPTGAYASGGFVEVDAVNVPGLYRVDVPDAALAAGADAVTLLIKGAAGLATFADEVELTAVDNQSTSFNLSIAKTTNVTGFNDIAATAVVSGGAINTAGGAVSTVTTTGTVTTVSDKTGYSLTQAFPANFATLGINATGHVSRVTLADTVTALAGHTAQTGDSFARLGLNGAGLTAIGDARLANLDAAVSTRSVYAGGAVASVTGAVGSVAGNVVGSVGSVTAGVSLAAAGLNPVEIEAGINAKQALSAILAGQAGVLSGATTGTILVRAAGTPTTTRMTATTDTAGNRTAVALNLPA